MSTAYIIAIAHESGGVGRTTTTLHLGYELARLGQRVCLVDLDPSGDLSRRLGLTPSAPTLAAALVADGDPPLPQPCRWDGIGLDVVPNDSDLIMAELLVTDLPQARERHLEGVLRSWRAQYDLVLLDCPAPKGLLLVNALNAADGVLIPLQTQDKAYAALARTAATIAAVWEYHNLAILGYLLTMTSHSNADRAIIAAVQADFPALVFRAAIPRRVEATLDGRILPHQRGGGGLPRSGRGSAGPCAGAAHARDLTRARPPLPLPTGYRPAAGARYLECSGLSAPPAG